MSEASKKELWPPLRVAYRELVMLTVPLVHDADVCRHFEQNGDDPQFWRRSLVRATFAVIEGITYKLKRIVLACVETYGDPCTDVERARLLEESIEYKEGDEIKLVPKFQPMDKNLKFTFKMLARVSQSEFVLDTNSKGWQAFRTAVEIRHRLTHPKEASFLIVSDAERDTVHEAMTWFTEQFQAVTDRAFEGWTRLGRTRDLDPHAPIRDLGAKS